MPDDASVLMTVEETADTSALHLGPYATGCAKEDPIRQAWPERAVPSRGFGALVNQNLHGKIGERNVDGPPPPEDCVALPRDARAKPVAGRISTGKKLGVPVNGHYGRRMT
jgi:hypothetical protein